MAFDEEGREFHTLCFHGSWKQGQWTPNGSRCSCQSVWNMSQSVHPCRGDKTISTGITERRFAGFSHKELQLFYESHMHNQGKLVVGASHLRSSECIFEEASRNLGEKECVSSFCVPDTSHKGRLSPGVVWFLPIKPTWLGTGLKVNLGKVDYWQKK